MARPFHTAWQAQVNNDAHSVEHTTLEYFLLSKLQKRFDLKHLEHQCSSEIIRVGALEEDEIPSNVILLKLRLNGA
eukprot:1162120-Pelagomonas_calceolata.AAC.1